MSSIKESWKIVKTIKSLFPIVDDKKVNLIDTHGESLEYDTEEEAVDMATLFENNSDSGHKYVAQKI